jgi:ABC-2 type transport system ATP-binding protein
MTALVIDGVGVKRAGRRVLDGVSLVAGAGDVIGVVGENGAGKSTLLSMCAGVLMPDRGAVTIDGASVWGPRRERVQARARLGYVPEAADPPGHLSCGELHALVAAVKGAALLGPAMLARLGLTDLGDHRLPGRGAHRRSGVGRPRRADQRTRRRWCGDAHRSLAIAERGRYDAARGQS